MHFLHDRPHSSPKAKNVDVNDLASFDNPYVRLVFVCKVCSKEQLWKNRSKWKVHFLTHSSDEDKPHQCDVCGKKFVQAGNMRKHRESHHKNVKAEIQIL